MADSPYEQIQAIRHTLADHITYLWMESPLSAAQAEEATRLLLRPVGAPEPLRLAAAMHDAHTEFGGEFDQHVEQAVDALMAVFGRAFRTEIHDLTDASLRRLGLSETPLLAGDSPTTASGEGVTGTPGAGSNEVPVTPAGGGSDA